MRQQGVEEALSIRTERQAEEGAVGSQLVAEGLRSGGASLTEGAFTVGSRLERGSTTGEVENDLFYEEDSSWLYRWDVTAWAWVAGLYVATNATRTGLTMTAEDEGALFYANDTGILWKYVSGSWVNEFVNLTVTTAFKVGANQVVGARGAAVADVGSPDATDLATALTLVNEIKAQVNTAFGRLRSTTGHGLWT